MTNYHPGTYVNSEEAANIDRFIRPGAVAFDVGANVGGWTTAVLCAGRKARVHLFEPAPDTFAALEANPLLASAEGLTRNRLALGERDGERVLHFYRDCAEMTTFYRRSDPQFARIAPPEPVAVPVASLDGYCRRHGVRHIDFLKIDVEGAELDVLKGAARMLGHARIDCIQFEYGGTYADAGVTLEDTHRLLDGHGYTLYRMLPGMLRKIDVWRPEFEDYRYANLLALHRRMLPFFTGERAPTLDLAALCRAVGVRPRGLLALGAGGADPAGHAGLRAMGLERTLLVEADPAMARRLAEDWAGVPGFAVAVCAVAGHDGRLRFRLASDRRFSSILPIARLRDVAPDVTEAGTIETDCRTVDGLLAALGADPAGFNLMAVSVQGAERLALSGATGVLRRIEGVLVDVGFDELYEGGAQIDDVDDVLEPLGFRRAALVCPVHPSLGNAFYVRPRQNKRTD